jgi:hypothetical protein
MTATGDRRPATLGPEPARSTTFDAILVTEELFLLLRRDSGQPEDSFAYSSYGLNAAVVADLLLTERVTASDEEDPRITVVTDLPCGHPVLDNALEVLRADPAGSCPRWSPCVRRDGHEHRHPDGSDHAGRDQRQQRQLLRLRRPRTSSTVTGGSSRGTRPVTLPPAPADRLPA